MPPIKLYFLIKILFIQLIVVDQLPKNKQKVINESVDHLIKEAIYDLNIIWKQIKILSNYICKKYKGYRGKTI